MVDIETLDTTATAVVVSIGAVLFDPNKEGPIFPSDTLYEVLRLQPQIDVGRTVSADTLKWWMQQAPEARNVFNVHAVAPVTALSNFGAFCTNAEGVWGNGSDFDNAILASAIKSFDLQGWRYSRNRCFRTLKNLGKTRDFVEPVRKGTHHNALDDAIYQAEYLQAVVKHLGLTL